MITIVLSLLSTHCHRHRPSRLRRPTSGVEASLPGAGFSHVAGRVQQVAGETAGSFGQEEMPEIWEQVQQQEGRLEGRSR